LSEIKIKVTLNIMALKVKIKKHIDENGLNKNSKHVWIFMKLHIIFLITYTCIYEYLYKKGNLYSHTLFHSISVGNI